MTVVDTIVFVGAIILFIVIFVNINKIINSTN